MTAELSLSTLRLSQFITAGCCAWRDARSACQLKLVNLDISDQQQMDSAVQLLKLLRSAFVSETTLKSAALSLTSLLLCSTHLSWKTLNNAGREWLVNQAIECVLHLWNSGPHFSTKLGHRLDYQVTNFRSLKACQAFLFPLFHFCHL